MGCEQGCPLAASPESMVTLELLLRFPVILRHVRGKAQLRCKRAPKLLLCMRIMVLEGNPQGRLWGAGTLTLLAPGSRQNSLAGGQARTATDPPPRMLNLYFPMNINEAPVSYPNGAAGQPGATGRLRQSRERMAMGNTLQSPKARNIFTFCISRHIQNNP